MPCQFRGVTKMLGEKRGSVIRDEMLRFRGGWGGLGHVDGGEGGHDGVVHCEDLH